MTFPFLSVITFTPIVAGTLLFFFPVERKDWARRFALAAAARITSALCCASRPSSV